MGMKARLEIDKSIIDFQSWFNKEGEEKLKQTLPIAKEIEQWCRDVSPIADGKYQGMTNLRFLWLIYLKELYDQKVQENDELNILFIEELAASLNSVFRNSRGRHRKGIRHEDNPYLNKR